MTRPPDDDGPAIPTDPIDDAERMWSEDMPASAAQVYAVATRILQVGALVEHSYVEGLKPVGVSIGEMMLLDTLRRRGRAHEATPGELKDHLLISFAGVGKRIARLEALGYVERRVSEADRRAQLVRLTGAGRSLLDDQRTLSGMRHLRAVAALSPGERWALGDILRKLQRDLEGGER